MKPDLGLDQDRQCKITIKPPEGRTRRLKRVNLMPNISFRQDLKMTQIHNEINILKFFMLV